MNSTCPIDAKPVSAKQTDGLDVKACEACGGAWLPSSSAGTLFSRLPNGVAHKTRFREGLRFQGRSSSLSCLDCGTVMRTVVQRGVEIDVCADCGGMWFDGGELQRFQQSGLGKSARIGAVAAGGAALGAAGLAGASAINPAQTASQGSSVASSVGEVAVDGVFEVAGDVLVAIIGSIFD